jgi:hypothetical protein
MRSERVSANGSSPGSRGSVDRLFLDANVLFTAAHNPDGTAAFLFDELAIGDWELISSGFAIKEARSSGILIQTVADYLT